MAIKGLDISPYQENPLYNQFIDWPKLKADPQNFRFIWIKCAEALDGTGYVEDASRQVAGARGVGFEAINPYHYYLFQWCDDAGIWHAFSPSGEAQAFYAAAKSCTFPAGQPMVDLEDPLIDRFLHWYDTPTINTAIDFARRLAKHIHAYLLAIEDLFEVRPSCYSGKWWLDKWVPLLLDNGYADEVAWMLDYDWILADYVGGLEVPSYVGRVIAWQYTSTPNPPVQGIPTGHAVPGDALDCDAWLLSEQEFEDWKKGKQTMATRAYLIPPETCARAITITQEDARFGITGFSMKDLAVTTAIIRAGYSTSSGSWKETVDLAWIPHVTGAIADKVPVTMWYELDPAWYRWNNVDENMVKDRSGHPDRQPVLLQILRCWYGDPAATWDQMKGAPAGNWRAISTIMLSQFNTIYQSQDVGDFWFTLSISDIFDQLHALMEGAQIPTVPLILQISPALLLKYPGLLAWVTARAKWLYLAYGDTAYNNGAVWTLDVGHTDIPTLEGCWPWTWFNIDPAKYAWFEPDGMHGRILYHETTKDRMYTPTFQTSGGLANRPVRLSLSPMLPADLMKILVPSVTVPGDPTIEELKARIAELQALNSSLSAQHVADTATIADLNAQIAAKDQALVGWRTWLAQAPVE